MQDKNSKLEALIKGCLRKERKSQKLLYEQFYSFGMKTCLRYSKNEEEAQEILNDGFLKVFQKMEQYNFKFPFYSWLQRILINSAIDYYRRNKRPTIFEIDSFKNYKSIRNEGELQLSLKDVIKILQSLPPAYRMVFNLYVIEGMTHPEIAKELGISVGTSKSNLAKARKRLRKIFGDSINLAGSILGITSY